jgi:hypothetical protein
MTICRYVDGMKRRKLSPHEIRVVAAAASVQDKTVQRYLEGKPGHMTTRIAIERELARLFPEYVQQSKAS